MELWDCEGNKSLRPDASNMNFFKECCDVVKEDVVNFMKEFQVTSVLPKAITTSFLALITKKTILKG